MPTNPSDSVTDFTSMVGDARRCSLEYSLLLEPAKVTIGTKLKSSSHKY